MVTAKARSNIRHFLKNLKRDEAIALGKRLLDKALVVYSSTCDDVPQKQIKQLLKSYNLKQKDDLFEEVGLGNRMPQVVARALVPGDGKQEAPPAKVALARPLMIKGTEGMVVTFGKCCHPIPGDRILGYVTAGRGIVIHTSTCKNVTAARSRPDRYIDVDWEENIEGEFSVDLRVELSNQRGALAIVASAISEMGANIINVSMEERDGMYSSISLTLTVKDRQHLARIMRRLRALQMVGRIIRMKG